MALFKKDILQTAEKLVQKGKIEAAIKEYKKVVAKNPSDTNTLNRVGDLYVRLRKPAHAVDYYMKTAERYALDGFYVKAIAVYKKVQRIDSSSMEVHGRLADLYAKQGLINEARNHYVQLADDHLRNNDTASAISVYEKVTDLDAANPTALLRLADLYRENKQPEKATESYEQIATLMIERGQVDHAIQVYERALRIEAGNLDFVSQAVLKIRDAGGVDRALDLIGRAEKQNPAASELRNLVSSPQTPLEKDSSEELAPLEDLEDLATEEFSRSQAVPPELQETATSAAMADAVATETPSTEVLLDLEEDLEAEREESKPSLVDPSTFSQAVPSEVVDAKEELPAVPEVPAPPEPFALRSADPPVVELEEPVEEPPLPAIPDTPPALSSSGEFDLGEIEELGEEAASIEEPPAEEETTSPGLNAEEALDAAFDRQVDPGPIPLEQIAERDGDSPQAAAEPTPSPEDKELEEKLSEAGVFKKYGLLDKALDRLNEVLARVPDHLDALSQAIKVLVERGDEARAATKAETLLLLCAQKNDRERWDEIAELLEAEGYQIEDDRVRTPGELTVSAAPEASADPYDQSPEQAEALEEAETDFSALASEPIELDLGEDHDMLDSQEFPLAAPEEGADTERVDLDFSEDAPALDAGHLPDSDAVEIEIEFDLDEPAAAESPVPAPLPAPPQADEAEGEEDQEGIVAAADDTPSWLDGDDAVTDDSQELFDDEEEFFDLASELQDELGTDLSDLDESLPENAAEQSLEEIVEGFKRGVAENISEEESDTHYNLGIAYREMMLLDEAINEFQISAKSDEYRVESCAMLGLCFREKGLADLAAKWYQKGLDVENLEEERRIGMLYELGDSLEASGDRGGASEAFTQVASMSAGYRDVEARLQSLSS